MLFVILSLDFIRVFVGFRGFVYVCGGFGRFGCTYLDVRGSEVGDFKFDVDRGFVFFVFCFYVG